MKSSPFLLVAENLLTTTRISSSASAAGVAMEVVKAERAAQRCAELRPAVVVVDLEAAPDVTVLITALRAALEPGTGRVIGFYPHVRTELRDAALSAGLDEAWPRSALEGRLGALLRAAAASAR